MPIYEFQCQSCDHRFETLVMKYDDAVLCKACSSDQLQKLISAHAIGHGAPDTACGNAPCSPAPMCGIGGCGR